MKYIIKYLPHCHYLQNCGINSAKSAAQYIINQYPQDDLVLILDHIRETFAQWGDQADDYVSKLCQLVELIKLSKPNWKVFLLVNIASKNTYDELLVSKFDDIFYFEVNAYRTLREIVGNKLSPVLYRWPKNADKFLFLTGIPSRINRIRLLYKLSQTELMDNCEWSFPAETDPVHLLKSQLLIPELSKTEFNDFIKKYSRKLDKNLVGHRHNSMLYEASVYANTCFSLVSETHFTTTTAPHISEKTYKSILNNHPFIIAGDTNLSNYLNSLGFITYEKYFAINDYDVIADPELRLDAVIENVRSFLTNIRTHTAEIEEIVQYNFDNLLKLYKDLQEEIQNFIVKNNLSLTADELINVSTVLPEPLIPINLTELTKKNNKFCTFYNIVKDKSWPECKQEADYDQLPVNIKQELCNVFGYVEEI